MATKFTFHMKPSRADEHLEALNNEVAAFLETRPYEVVIKKDIPAGKLSTQVIYRHAPPDLLLMLIGDVLHNLRSALDHLAWSLAGTEADRSTEFSIFVDEIKYRSGATRKMHDMPTTAQNIIESLQPYKGVHGLPESEPLWLLQQLSNEDKHHTLNLVAAQVDVQLHVSTGSHPAYGLTGRTGCLTREDGEEISRIPLPADPSQVQDYSHYTFDVALDPKGPGRGIPITLHEGLSNIRDAVAGAIRLLEPSVP
jgi:hypothetical protein